MTMTNAVMDHGACLHCSTSGVIVWHDGSCPRLTVDSNDARERAADGFSSGDGGPRRNIKGRIG